MSTDDNNIYMCQWRKFPIAVIPIAAVWPAVSVNDAMLLAISVNDATTLLAALVKDTTLLLVVVVNDAMFIRSTSY